MNYKSRFYLTNTDSKKNNISFLPSNPGSSKALIYCHNKKTGLLESTQFYNIQDKINKSVGMTLEELYNRTVLSGGDVAIFNSSKTGIKEDTSLIHQDKLELESKIMDIENKMDIMKSQADYNELKAKQISLEDTLNKLNSLLEERNKDSNA